MNPTNRLATVAEAIAGTGATAAPFAAQRSHLADLDAIGRARTLMPRHGVDFTSNDYLALAASPRFADAVIEALRRGVAIGSGGSRLLRGNDPEHVALETRACALFGVESALFFGSGYAANMALLSALPQTGDLVVHDALTHASAHDGMRLGRAETVSVPHNDAGAFEEAVRRWRRRGGTGTAWIAVESLYSMDGDRAPLDDLAQVADRHGGVLIVDEAHATGVWGPGGRGLAASLEGRANVITVKTFGKALGCEGALVCGPAVVRDFLVSRARGFIFSTAPSPLMAVAARESLGLLVDEPERRVALHALVAAAEALLAPLGAACAGSQIVPLVIGDDARTVAVAAAVQAAGFDVRAIRPPTVAPGTARLRIALTLHATQADVAALAAVLRRVL